jgi:hypothetical protein
MKKLVLMSLCVVLLSSCTGSSLNPRTINKANELCENNDGLFYIWVLTGRIEVNCKNGAKFEIKKID